MQNTSPACAPGAGHTRHALKTFAALAIFAAGVFTPAARAAAQGGLPAGFVYLRDIAPDIVQDMRYATSHNFLGRPVKGYLAGECILTRRAARALAHVQKRLRRRGLSLKVYDCYRPVRAVRDFVRWARDTRDRKTKAEFYPLIPKTELFKRHYIARHSRHSRGSTVDLTIVRWPARPQPKWDPRHQKACHLPAARRYADNSLDFGTGYDCFHPLSHTANPRITGAARRNRELLVSEMLREGFRNYRREWWHFELINEPFKKEFDFPVTARPRAAGKKPPGAPRMRAGGYRLACAGRGGALVREGPGEGYGVLFVLKDGKLPLRVRKCLSGLTPRGWRALSPIARKMAKTPWCLITSPEAGGEAGWLHLRHIAPAGTRPECQ